MKAQAVPPVQARSQSACPSRPKRRTKDTVAYASLLKAVADESRLSILGLLAAADGELCVCEVEAHVGHLSQPTISHHLKQLREAGLVTAERRGTWVYYSLDPNAVARLRDFVGLLGG